MTSVLGEVGIMVAGCLYSSCISNVEFLPLANPVSWTKLADLNEGRFNHGFESLNGRPTVFGGENQSDQILNNFEYYDENENRWIRIQNLTLTKPKTRFAFVKI